MDIWGIRYDGSDLWLLPYESMNVYKWYLQEDRLIKYESKETEWITSSGPPYINMAFLDNQIILLPSRLKYIMRIDMETNTIQKAFDYPEGFRFLKNKFGLEEYPAFGAFDILDRKLIMHPLLGNMLLIFDIEKNYVEGLELIVSDEEVPYLSEIMQEGYQLNGIYYEAEEAGGLKALISLTSRDCKKENRESAGYAGKEIYDKIKESKF